MKVQRTVVFFLVLTMPMFGSVARAATYYLDPFQGVDSHTNYEAQHAYYPWRHIQVGIANAASGDTLLLAPGFYSEKIVVSKRLTIIGTDRNICVIQYPAGTGYGAAVNIGPGIDGVVLRELTVDGNPTPNAGATDGVLCGVGVDGLVLHRVMILNCIGSGVRALFDGTVDGSINTGFVIDSCLFKNINGGRAGNLPACGIVGDRLSHARIVANDFHATGIGIWLSGSVFPDTSGGTGVIVRGCRFENLLQNAIAAVSESNCTIDSCVIRRCGMYAIPESAWSATYPGAMCVVGKGVNVSVLYNILRENGGVMAPNAFYTNPASHLLEGPGYYGWPAAFFGGDAGVSFRFNSVLDNAYGGVFVASGGSYVVTDNYIYSNGALNATGEDYGMSAPSATIIAGDNWWGSDLGPAYDGVGLRNGVFGNAVNLSAGGVRALTGRNSFDLRFSPNQIIYNIIHVGNHQDTTCRFRNYGIGPAFTSAPFVGGAASQFVILNPTSGQVLNPGDSIDVTVRFAPTQIGLLRGKALLAPDTSNAEVGPLLYGFGGLAVLSTRDTMTFDTLAPGWCIDTGLVIANAGTESLHIDSASFLGADAADFSIADPLPIDIDPNRLQVIHLRFCPTHIGQKSARVLFIANTQPMASVVEIRGASSTSSRLSATPDSVALGIIRLGASRDTAIIVRNDASRPLRIDSVAFTGNNTNALSLTTSLPLAIAPGFTGALRLRCTPHQRGAIDASLVATASDHTVFAVPVTSGGGIYEVTKSQRTILDTSVSAGTSAEECLRFTNSGDFPVGILFAQLDGGNDQVYTLGQFSTTDLAPGREDTVCVTFKPLRAGNFPELLVLQYSESSLPLDTVVLGGSAFLTAVAQHASLPTDMDAVVFPDPFVNAATVRITGWQRLHNAAFVYDALGRVVMDCTNTFMHDGNAHDADFVLDASALPAGVYLLTIRDGTRTISRTLRKAGR